jgi:hypothetical protein
MMVRQTTRQSIRDARLDALVGQKDELSRALTLRDIPLIAAAVESALAPRLLNPGDVFFRAVSVTPAGALPADGAEVPRLAYRALFNAIGTTVGPGDGTTTFDLPNITAPSGLTAFIKT